MGLLDTIKSLLGMNDSSENRGRRDTNVTVERDTETEPSARTEAAVKGTEDDEIAAETGTGGPDEADSSPSSDQRDAAAEADADATGAEAAEAAETGESEAETATSGTRAAEAEAPGSGAAGSEAVDAESPQTGAADSETVDAESPQTGATESDAAEAEAPETESSMAEAEPSEPDSAEADDSEAADDDSEFTSEAAMEAVTNIKGIGPAYAERLSEAGVDSVADLATADADELADAIDVSEKRIGRWIDRARDYAEE